MWPVVEKDLASLLASKTYPVLTGNKKSEELLVGGVPDPARCQAAAAKIVQDVQKSGGVKEFGSKQAAKAEIWKDQLFRGVSPRNNPKGKWWFDGELVKRWEQIYTASMPRLERREKIFESLRPMLAVCYDWNDFTQLWVMRLDGGTIPVITGQGASQPLYSPQEKQKHQQYHNVAFIGGYQQVYVPFVPDRVAQYLL
jgi:hypothetical protein